MKLKKGTLNSWKSIEWIYFFITVRGTVIPDITQIAAMDLKTVRSSPHMWIHECRNSPETQKVAGISVDANGSMSVNGCNVDSVSIVTYIVCYVRLEIPWHFVDNCGCMHGLLLHFVTLRLYY